MSGASSTPVKVPPSAANHSAATLDPELRSQINTLLLKEGHVTNLNANQANWPTLIQNHALNLLRNGEVTTFPALLRRVLDDVRQDTLNPPAPSTASPSTSKTNGTTDKDKKTNGASSTPTAAAGTAASAADPNNPPSLAVPAAVVEEAIKVTRDSLEAVCEIDNAGGS
ncbi:hypothetical protein COL922a_003610 [Colletotrichum nupharicola]|nr:hypothetical protein COL922a_003610 [Colletotrichum nupharicola]